VRRLDPGGRRWEVIAENPEGPIGPAWRRVAVLEDRALAGERRARPVDRRKARRVRRAG
jgi:hypothetical protein